MDKNRLWMLGTIVLIAGVIVLGWVLGISPKLDDASASASARASVDAENSAHEVDIALLRDQFSDIATVRKEAATLREAIPNEADAPALVRQFDSLAVQSQVTLTAITLGDAEPSMIAPVAADAAASVPADAAAPVATDAAAPAATDPAASSAAVPASAAGAGLTPENFVSVPVSLTVDGDYSRVLDFIGGLQAGERLVLVSSFSTASATESFGDPAATGAVTASISAYVFVLLD